jgi:hypothetical protein
MLMQPGQLLLQVLLLIGGDVLERCMAMVRQLKGITATYRMTAKGPPVRHSHYVAGKAAAGHVAAAAGRLSCRAACCCWQLLVEVLPDLEGAYA